MLVEHRNGVNAKATERFLAITADGCRTAVLTPRSLTVNDFMPELSGNINTVFIGSKDFSRKFLVVQRTVNNGGVKQGYAPVNRFRDNTLASFLVGILAAVVGHAHYTESESRNLECS